MKMFLLWVLIVVGAIIVWPLTITFLFFLLVDWLLDGEAFGLCKPEEPRKK